MKSGGNYIVKTHFPQNNNQPDRYPILNELFKNCKFVTVQRDINKTYQSTLVWKELGANKYVKYLEGIERFNDFWSDYSLLKVSFDELINPHMYSNILDKIGILLECDRNDKIIYPFPKNATIRVYFAKAMTRILGRFAPIVNTTIRFNLTP